MDNPIGEKLRRCAICQEVIEKKLGTTSLLVRKRGYNQLNCWFSLCFDNSFKCSDTRDTVLFVRGEEPSPCLDK
jgi:hypothetical protein